MSALGVLVVTDAYPPRCGGSGWSTHALVRALRSAGHRVDVLEVASGAASDGRREVDGVAVERLGLARHRTPRARLGTREFSFGTVRERVAGLLRDRPEIDIVHAQHLHSAPGSIVAAHQAGLPAVVTLRDLWPVRLDGLGWPDEPVGVPVSRARTVAALRTTFGVSWPLAHLLVGRARARLRWRGAALAGADRVIAVSVSVRDRVAGEIEGVSPVVIPSVVDAADARRQATLGKTPGAAPERPYVLAAGKLTAAKGFDALVDRLADAGLRSTLRVAGSGPLRDHVEQRAAARGVTLQICDWLEAPELLALTAGADALLLPSACEDSLSRLVVEALALGTPVIGTATGGTPEAVTDGDNGWLIRDDSDWHRALRALEAGRAAAAAAALRSAARYAPKHVIPQVESVYRDALAEARA